MHNTPAQRTNKRHTAQIQLMVARKSNINYQANCSLEGAAQHANHREDERRELRRGREEHTVFIPLCASSDSQEGSAHNVSPDMTLSVSIVS